NPVSYFDTAALDSLPAAERAGLNRRERVTMVVTWNPERWNPDGWAENVYPGDVETVESGRVLRGRWATGNRKTAEALIAALARPTIERLRTADEANASLSRHGLADSQPHR